MFSSVIKFLLSIFTESTTPLEKKDATFREAGKKNILVKNSLHGKALLSALHFSPADIAELLKLFGPFFVGQSVGVDMQVIFQHGVDITDPVCPHIPTTVLYNFFNSASFSWISSPSLPEAARKRSSSVRISSSPPSQQPFSNTSLNFSGSVCPAVEA